MSRMVITSWINTVVATGVGLTAGDGLEAGVLVGAAVAVAVKVGEGVAVGVLVAVGVGAEVLVGSGEALPFAVRSAVLGYATAGTVGRAVRVGGGVGEGLAVAPAVTQSLVASAEAGRAATAGITPQLASVLVKRISARNAASTGALR